MRDDDDGGTAPVALVLAPAIVHSTVDGEMVLLDLAAEHYYGLDAVGARVVTVLTSTPLERGLEALAAELGVARAVLAVDVEALVAELVAAGLASWS
jgi:hypothetical protein